MPLRGNRWKIIEMSVATNDYKMLGYGIDFHFGQYRVNERLVPVEVCRELWEDLVLMGFRDEVNNK
jgi:hypothetical protein